jgi:hypothetical protein
MVFDLNRLHGPVIVVVVVVVIIIIIRAAGQYISLKSRYVATKLHSVTSQKTVLSVSPLNNIKP